MIDRAAAVSRALAHLGQDDAAGAFKVLEPHLEQLAEDVDLARVWAGVVGHLSDPAALATEIGRFSEAWGSEPKVMLPAVHAAVRWCRRFPLARKAVRDPVARAGAEAARRCLHAVGGATHDPDVRHGLHLALAEALVEVGPAVDDDALTAFELALQTRPDDAAGWLALARLHTRRGRFAKGRDATQHALSIEHSPAGHWNLALCLTALGAGEAAAEAWQALDHEAVLNREGEAAVAGLEPVEVYLPADTPRVGTDFGSQAKVGDAHAVESVWVRPISPCHGRLVSATRLELPADFDDVILWDGAPVDFRHADGRDVPRFRALAVLRQGRAQTLGVRGRLPFPKALIKVHQGLPEGCFVHPFAQPGKGPFEGKLVFPRTLDAEAAWQALVRAAAEAEVEVARVLPEAASLAEADSAGNP
jgi:tetratricopeptide (TPR) repeat protein